MNFLLKSIFLTAVIVLSTKSLNSQMVLTTKNTVAPSFTLPDTVCVNTPITINNLTTGASSYYWNFCVTSINSTPTGTNLGNIGNNLIQPVFVDIAEDGGNYYAFVVNHIPGHLTRLDFGNSLLNTPTSINLGNFSGVLPENAEGIQIVKNEGNWYIILVGGSNLSPTSSSRIIKITLGASITNTNPLATSWGNIGNLSYPVDLHIFNDNAGWYGFTVNATNNSITRFNFGNSFNNTPTGFNLGNIGNLNFPVGICAVKENNNWYVFVPNQGSSTLTRLDFGASLLNIPVGTNLGSINGTMNRPRDTYIMKFCGQIVGFIVNELTNDIVRLNFQTITSTPTGTSLGNIGNFSFPHSLSKLFRVGADLYSLIPNVNNNTITRIKFSGCNNASIPNSTLQNPPSFSYSTPGVYNINLMVDEGLETQESLCKSVVVVAPPTHTPTQNLFKCSNDSITITSPVLIGTSLWNTGQTTKTIRVKDTGIYWVETTTFSGCTVRDSIKVSNYTLSIVNKSANQSICKDSSVQIFVAGSNFQSYSWTPTSGLNNSFISNPIASPNVTTYYFVTITDVNGCIIKDSVLISIVPKPQLQIRPDTSICVNKSLLVTTSYSNANVFSWLPVNGLSNATISNPIVTASVPTTYILTAYNGSCFAKDTFNLGVLTSPTIIKSLDTTICKTGSAILFVSGGTSYLWSPAYNISSTTSSTVTVMPDTTLYYKVNVTDANNCTNKDSIKVTVNPKPILGISPISSAICKKDSILLRASGGDYYTWTPALYVLNPDSSNTKAFPASTTLFKVIITNSQCKIKDTLSTYVVVNDLPKNFITKSNDIDCSSFEASINVSGGVNYLWENIGGITDFTTSSLVVKPQTTTTYYVKIIDVNGCFVRDSVTVKVDFRNSNNLFLLPSAFTPNKDNLNDCFGVKNWSALTSFDFNIYNRFGQMIFHTNNSNECWDGKFRGIDVEIGTYVYQIKAKSACGGDIYRKGTIVLIR